MSFSGQGDSEQNIFRVDRFVVPTASRDEFLSRVLMTHRLLRRQPGFVRDHLLEQKSGEGASIIITVAQWQDQAAVDRAVPAIRAEHEKIGFDARATVARLGVDANFGVCAPIPENELTPA